MQPFTAIYVKMVFESQLEGIRNYEFMSSQLQKDPAKILRQKSFVNMRPFTAMYMAMLSD